MPTQSRELIAIAEDLARAGTLDDTILVISKLSGAFLHQFDLVKQGVSTLDQFASLVGDAGAVLGEQPGMLGRLEEAIRADINILKQSHKYENVPMRPPRFNRSLIESYDAEQAMMGYASVGALCEKRIDAIDTEIEGLATEKARLEEFRDDARIAAFKGDEFEEAFEEFNAEGISLISGTDKIWLDFKAFVNKQLALRWTAAEEVLERIDERIEFLGKERIKLEEVDNVADWMWWHELILHGADDPFAPDGSAAAILGNANKIAASLPAAPASVASIAGSIAVFNAAMREQVARLAAGAADADSEAARMGNMLAIFNLIRSGLSLANDLSSGGGAVESETNTGAATDAGTSSEIKMSPVLKKPGPAAKPVEIRKFDPQKAIRMRGLGMQDSFPYWSERYGLEFG